MTESQTPVSTEIAKVTLRDTALGEIDKVAAGLAALKDRYGNVVYDVTTTKGMREASEARAAIRELRYQVPHIVKAKKAELKEISEKIGTRGDEIIAAFKALEDPIHDQIKAEEDRREAEREAKETAERERIERLQARVAGIRSHTLVLGGSASVIQAAIVELDALAIDESFEEYATAAQRAKGETLATLDAAMQKAIAHEAEVARIAEERAELAKLRAQAEAAEKVRQEAAAAAERERLAKLKAEQDELDRKRAETQKAIDEANAIAAAQRAEADRVARELLLAEEQRLADERAKVRAEQDAIDAERRRLEEAERAEAQRKQDAADAEARRIEQEARAERQRKEDAEQARTQRVRDAAELMLAALQRVVASALFKRMSADDQAAVNDALAAALDTVAA